jgi:flagellar basal-body rod protein FlgB
MAITGFPMLDALKTKMKWHQTRQGILAENVANADTPGYMPRELAKPDFSKMLAKPVDGEFSTATTHTAHIKGASPYGSGQLATDQKVDWEITPEGNAVVLEDQMTKIAENQLEYQMASQVYSRSLGMIKTALGRGGA